MPLREIELLSDEGVVADAGGSHSRRMMARDGSRWVMKSTYFGSQRFKYLYLNEGLTAVIAQRIGAPVPEAAVLRLTQVQVAEYMNDALYKRPVEFHDSAIFASRLIAGAQHLTAEAVAGADKDAIAALLVLDQLVWNFDRGDQPQHVLVEVVEGRRRLWGVDHGNTFSPSDLLLEEYLDPERIAEKPYELLRQQVQGDDIKAAIDAARSVTEDEFLSLARSLPVEWIVEEDAPPRLARALAARTKRLDQLLLSY